MNTTNNLVTSKLLADTKPRILADWMAALLKDPRLRGNLISREETQHFAGELLDALCVTVAKGNLNDITAPEFVRPLELLTAMSARQEGQGFTPFETATSLLCVKDAILPLLAEAYRSDVKGLAEQTFALNRLVDTLALNTFESLQRRREETITRQSREILEIATPVVRLWEGVLLAPLIGTLDSSRTQRVLESLLQAIVQNASSVVIIDITGVPALDTKTSQHLIETASAVRLLGAQMIVTGMRPAIAQTLVHLGVDMADITTRSSLAAGLARAFDMLGLEAVRRAEGGSRA